MSGPADSHLDLLREFPALSEACFGVDHVVMFVGGWAYERLTMGDVAAAGKVLDWFEEILRDAPPEVCEDVGSALTMLLSVPFDVLHLLGPLALERVTR